MLLRFRVSNHRSFRDLQDVSFVASSLKERKGYVIDCAAAPNNSVVPAAVVYGANASGKSNLVDAMKTMCNMVLHSHTKGDPGGGVARQWFRLDPECLRAATQFDIDFVAEGTRYHYGFQASDAAFVSEWLDVYPKAYRRLAFSRDSSEFTFGRWLKGQNSSIAKLTRPNSLFLSAAAQNGHQQLAKVFTYFRSIRVVRDIAVHGTQLMTRLAQGELDRRVITFLGKLGTGVMDSRQIEAKDSEQFLKLVRPLATAAGKSPRALAEELGSGGMETVVELVHSGRDNEPIPLDLDRESAGTRRLLAVMGIVYRALDDGTPVLVDELDASLHTHASEAVLGLFCSARSNPKGAQLLATTHDTNLMKSSSLRRDQLWFTQKDAEGATQIYPLTDFKTRWGDNFELGYLQGRYGAVPFEDVESPHATSG